MIVESGEIVIDVVRAPCPEADRPCGLDCPFVKAERVERHVFRPEPQFLRGIFERLYCGALVEGSIEWQEGGVTTTLSTEVDTSGGSADARPVRSLHVEMEGQSHEISVADLTRPIEARSRATDSKRHGRVGREYWSTVAWRPEERSGEGPRRGRRAASRVGRQVVLGRMPADAQRVPLDQPESQDGRRPLTEVVWHDLEGLDLARRSAAAEPGREIAFFLLGDMRFDPELKTPYTTVHRVVPVEEREYLRSDALRCAIGPDGFARARGLARSTGRQVLGVLHSHCLEMKQPTEDESHTIATEQEPSEGPPPEKTISPSGLFYSATDVADHSRLFPSAWSLGGVLNLRPFPGEDGTAIEVQTAVFARAESGSFVPVESLIIPETRRSQ